MHSATEMALNRMQHLASFWLPLFAGANGRAVSVATSLMQAPRAVAMLAGGSEMIPCHTESAPCSKTR